VTFRPERPAPEPEFEVEVEVAEPPPLPPRRVDDPWGQPEADPRVRPTEPSVRARTLIEAKRPVFPEPRSPRVWWIVTGIAVAVVVAVGAVLAVTAIRNRPEPVASATPTATPTPSPTPSPSVSPTATFAAPAEETLAAYVNERVGPNAFCEGDPELPKRATARLRCQLPGGFPATYTQFETLKALKAYFKTLRGDGRPEDLGNCAAEGEWFGDDDKVAGDLIGRRVGARAVLSWSDEPQRVAAYASSKRSDRSELCDSWESYG
jgi:hypothetical protein